MRTYGQDTERPDGLKVPSKCIWVPQFLLRVEKSQMYGISTLPYTF